MSQNIQQCSFFWFVCWKTTVFLFPQKQFTDHGLQTHSMYVCVGSHSSRSLLLTEIKPWIIMHACMNVCLCVCTFPMYVCMHVWMDRCTCTWPFDCTLDLLWLIAAQKINSDYIWAGRNCRWTLCLIQYVSLCSSPICCERQYPFLLLPLEVQLICFVSRRQIHLYCSSSAVTAFKVLTYVHHKINKEITHEH